MSDANVSIDDVVTQLDAEGLLNAETGAVEQAVGKMADIQPWYVRTMVGFGAWVASLMLIGFVASIGLTFDWGFAFFGLGFMVGAVLVRNTSNNDFMVQCSLAASLAGQALFVYGTMEGANWDLPEIAVGIVIFLNVVLFVVFPDRIHRVLSVLLIVGAATMLLYMWKWNVVIPLLGPVLATLLVFMDRNRSRFVAGGKGAFLRPLLSGLMLSAFGCLMISTIYVLPELGGSFEFYPRPWISTILLGALLLYVARDSWDTLLAGAGQTAEVVVYGLLVVVMASAWIAPGLLLALVVILLGAKSGHRTMLGAGVGFLVVFLGAYFYGIQLTMLQKSATLIGTGVVVLVARFVMLKLLSRSAGEPDHV